MGVLGDRDAGGSEGWGAGGPGVGFGVSGVLGAGELRAGVLGGLAALGGWVLGYWEC